MFGEAESFAAHVVMFPLPEVLIMTTRPFRHRQVESEYNPFALYWDEDCTQKLGPLLWRELHEGEKNIVTIYARNESDYEVRDIDISISNPNVIVRSVGPTRVGPGQIVKAVIELSDKLNAKVHLGMSFEDLQSLGGEMVWHYVVTPKVIPFIPSKKEAPVLPDEEVPFEKVPVEGEE